MKRSSLAFGVLSHSGSLKESKHSDGNGGAGHSHNDQTKKGISNLEQYLGAVGHVVILSDDAEQYLHVHPVDEKATGPKADFMTSFKKSGIYKIWAQFQHQGKVFTVSFVVDIK